MTEPWTRDAVTALGLTTDVPTAGAIFGMSTWQSYKLARSGRFPVPVLRLGERRMRVSTAAILRALDSA